MPIQLVVFLIFLSGMIGIFAWGCALHYKNIGCWMFAGLITTFFIGCFVCLGMFSKHHVDDWVLTATEHICTLRDDSEINGEFHGSMFASSGYINETLYYSYMVDNGSYKIANKIVAARTRIYEVKSDFRVEWYDIIERWWIFTNKGYYTYWKLYIPAGSIVSGYAIDLH